MRMAFQAASYEKVTCTVTSHKNGRLSAAVCPDERVWFYLLAGQAIVIV